VIQRDIRFVTIWRAAAKWFGVFHWPERYANQEPRLPRRVGEIEGPMNALPDLQESAVVAIDRSGFEGWLICFAYVLQRASLATPVSLREELEKNIPGYTIPARWMTGTTLPKNANGKIDRPKPKELFLQTQDCAHSQNDPMRVQKN
jgi:hypothetical protein